MVPGDDEEAEPMRAPIPPAALPLELVDAEGFADFIGEVLRQQGITRPLICTDRGLPDLGMVADLRATLGNEIAVTVFDETPENPTEAAVLKAAAKYREAGCDGIIAFGGGSSIDLAKTAALAMSLLDWVESIWSLKKTTVAFVFQ